MVRGDGGGETVISCQAMQAKTLKKRKKNNLPQTQAHTVKVSFPEKEYVGSTIDMKGLVFYSPHNNLTRDLIEKVKKAAKTYSQNSLRIFGKSQRSKLGKSYSENAYIEIFENADLPVLT